MSGDDLSCDLTGLMEDTYYFVRVYAENDAGISRRALEMSQPVCAKRPRSKTRSLFLLGMLFLIFNCAVLY